MRCLRPFGAAAALVLVISSPAGGGSTRPDHALIDAFVGRHWKHPVAPQGPPPRGFSPLEASLRPSDCGTCHPSQYADWKTSVHARSMSPGVTGQLVDMWRSDKESARLCLTCHAPLAEQQPENGAAFDPALQRQGLVCAACHVRGHRRFGPPRRTASASAGPETLPHRGATRTPAFLASQFCASCHQFTSDGFALNGKPLENTYAEWTASPAAREGRQCQDCHMPERRHLWRGIHDPGMVRSGVYLKLATAMQYYRLGELVRARITLVNSGVGHHFPTYVTPRVVVRATLVDAAGRERPGTGEEWVIAREVALDLSTEVFDSRIAAGERASFDYRRRLDAGAARLRVTVTVLPDYFYTRFFESLLGAGGAGEGAREIREALEVSRRTAFELYRRELPLTR